MKDIALLSLVAAAIYLLLRRELVDWGWIYRPVVDPSSPSGWSWVKEYNPVVASQVHIAGSETPYFEDIEGYMYGNEIGEHS